MRVTKLSFLDIDACTQVKKDEGAQTNTSRTIWELTVLQDGATCRIFFVITDFFRVLSITLDNPHCESFDDASYLIHLLLLPIL